MTQLKTDIRRGLSGNALKLIAAAAMAVDHIGLMFFPANLAFRIIGRLAFPIFAFMIAEGCRYTKNRLRYFLSVFVLGIVCQAVYYIVARSTYLSVLITFSLSILTLYALQFFRESVGDPACPVGRKLVSAAVFAGAVAGVWWLNEKLRIDYGFWGCMLPVFAGLLMQRRGGKADCLTGLDRPLTHVLTLGLGALLLSLQQGGIQAYSLLALPLLALYSGRRGKGKLKYFFYIFYPVHLAALEGLRMLLAM